MKQVLFKLTEETTNKKLTSGEKLKTVHATTSSWLTCSPFCPLHSVCYAKKGHQKLHADHITRGSRGYEFNKLITQVSEVRPNSLIRLSVSGDLPSISYEDKYRKIDKLKVLELKAASQKAGATTYTYSHLHSCPKNKEYNLNAYKEISSDKFVINVSTENKITASKLYHQNHDVVITDTKLFNFAVEQQQLTGKKAKLIVNNKTVDLFPCDAQYKESNCNKCRKCAEFNRSEIVIFKQH